MGIRNKDNPIISGEVARSEDFNDTIQFLENTLTPNAIVQANYNLLTSYGFTNSNKFLVDKFSNSVSGIKSTTHDTSGSFEIDGVIGKILVPEDPILTKNGNIAKTDLDVNYYIYDDGDYDKSEYTLKDISYSGSNIKIRQYLVAHDERSMSDGIALPIYFPVLEEFNFQRDFSVVVYDRDIDHYDERTFMKIKFGNTYVFDRRQDEGTSTDTTTYVSSSTSMTLNYRIIREGETFKLYYANDLETLLAEWEGDGTSHFVPITFEIYQSIDDDDGNGIADTYFLVQYKNDNELLERDFFYIENPFGYYKREYDEDSNGDDDDVIIDYSIYRLNGKIRFSNSMRVSNDDNSAGTTYSRTDTMVIYFEDNEYRKVPIKTYANSYYDDETGQGNPTARITLNENVLLESVTSRTATENDTKSKNIFVKREGETLTIYDEDEETILDTIVDEFGKLTFTIYTYGCVYEDGNNDDFDGDAYCEIGYIQTTFQSFQHTIGLIDLDKDIQSNLLTGFIDIENLDKETITLKAYDENGNETEEVELNNNNNLFQLDTTNLTANISHYLTINVPEADKEITLKGHSLMVESDIIEVFSDPIFLEFGEVRKENHTFNLDTNIKVPYKKTHTYTDWIILDENNDVVLEFLNSTDLFSKNIDLTSLTNDTNYKIKVRFVDEDGNGSNYTQEEFLLLNEYAPNTPILQNTELIIGENILTLNEFSTLSNNSHISTDWLITNLTTGQELYNIVEDTTNLTTLTIDLSEQNENDDIQIKARFNDSENISSEYLLETLQLPLILVKDLEHTIENKIGLDNILFGTSFIENKSGYTGNNPIYNLADTSNITSNVDNTNIRNYPTDFNNDNKEMIFNSGGSFKLTNPFREFTDFSFSFFFQRTGQQEDETNQTQRLFGCVEGDDIIIKIKNDNTCEINVKGNIQTLSVENIWDDTSYQNITITYDKTTMKFYRNGKLFYALDISFTISYTQFFIDNNISSSTVVSDELYFGSPSNDDMFIGNMKNILIVDRTLTDEETDFIWNNGNGLCFNNHSYINPEHYEPSFRYEYNEATSQFEDLLNQNFPIQNGNSLSQTNLSGNTFNSLNFDGVDDYLQFTNNLFDLNSNFGFLVVGNFQNEIEELYTGTGYLFNSWGETDGTSGNRWRFSLQGLEIEDRDGDNWFNGFIVLNGTTSEEYYYDGDPEIRGHSVNVENKFFYTFDGDKIFTEPWNNMESEYLEQGASSTFGFSFGKSSSPIEDNKQFLKADIISIMVFQKTLNLEEMEQLLNYYKYRSFM